MNSHLQSDLERPSTLWCVVHTRSRAHKVELKTRFKKLGPVLPDTESTEVSDIASGLKKTAVCVCVSVCQPVFLSVCASACVGVFEGIRRDLNMHWEQVCMYVMEKSVFLYNLGLIFIVLATTSIRHGNILLTNFMNMSDTGQTVFLVQRLICT